MSNESYNEAMASSYDILNNDIDYCLVTLYKPKLQIDLLSGIA